MSTRPQNNWAGLFSIVWQVGGFALIYLLIHYGIHFHFEPLWLFLLLTLGAWLGAGLLFAIAGLTRGNRRGQIFAVVAICVFIYFAWQILAPCLSNPQPHTVTGGRLPNDSKLSHSQIWLALASNVDSQISFLNPKFRGRWALV